MLGLSGWKDGKVFTRHGMSSTVIGDVRGSMVYNHRHLVSHLSGIIGQGQATLKLEEHRKYYRCVTIIIDCYGDQ